MAEFSLGSVLKDVKLCVGFFTRLPIGHGLVDRRFSDAIWAAPVAGLIVGFLVGMALWILVAAGLQPQIAGALALGFSVLLTGALHEDGLADVADGFGGGRDRDAKLAIMRDSRIGTYGVIAVALSLLLRWIALSTIAGFDGAWILLSVIAAHMASRALLPAFLHLVRPARSDGLGAGVGQVRAETAFVALVLGSISLLTLGMVELLTAVVVLALLFFGLAALTRQQIGGQTGDVLGALQQAAEATILILATSLANDFS